LNLVFQAYLSFADGDIFHLQMASGQTGVSGVIVPVVELKLGLDHATVQLQPMEDKIAHLKLRIQLNGLKAS